MDRCPYLVRGECMVAALLGICYDRVYGAHGRCVVIKDRCMGRYVTQAGVEVREWETCSFYLRAADCRYCRYFDKKTGRCLATGRPVAGAELRLCSRYEGPRPVPTFTTGV